MHTFRILLHWIFLFLMLGGSPLSAQSTRVVTANVWSGLDYLGWAKMGEYESVEVREKRFRILVDELRTLNADLIALQEVNPVSQRSREIAEELGYDYIFQRVNGGAKIGGLGLPVNLDEGLVILARKELQLRFVDVWDLGSGFGVFGDLFSFHWKERRAALIGAIHVGSAEVFVVNVHLSSAVPEDSVSRLIAQRIASLRCNDSSEVSRTVEDCFADAGNRMKSVEILLENIEKRLDDRPILLLGDFNAPPDAPEIVMLQDKGKFFDLCSGGGKEGVLTWDPERNMNTRFSVQAVDARGDTLDVYGLLSAWYDGRARRVDYLLANEAWHLADVKDVKVVLEKPKGGLFASDHYGLTATLSGAGRQGEISEGGDRIPESAETKLEGFPILSYDTDVGFGYGAKAFFLNFLNLRESFDLTAFNSTKGERWYRFVFSLPDFELRQGKLYDLAFDLTADYDKYLKMNYFGIGADSRWDDGETYTKEPLEIWGIFSRGFTREFVVQLGLKYRTVRNVNYEPLSLFARTAGSVNFSRSSALTFYGSARYDSRDSFINPARGSVVEVEIESGGSELSGDYSLTSAAMSIQSYNVLFYPKTVLAAKLWGRVVGGSDLPLHILCSVGGNRTLRGYPQDRFLDKAAAVLNAELRFPIYWRFGGVLGVDAGRVAGSMKRMSLARWSSNSVVGLRFLMDTFVVRADLGFGKETTGFYLNFGHLF
jgi:endonuclease/exonuclease/phosphatase family metal-dependent hydrolase